MSHYMNETAQSSHFSMNILKYFLSYLTRSNYPILRDKSTLSSLNLGGSNIGVQGDKALTPVLEKNSILIVIDR